MPNNSWTKEDIVKLKKYDNEDHVFFHEDEEIHIVFPDLGSNEFNFWCQGADAWVGLTDEGLEAVLDASPTFTYNDCYGIVYYLDEFSKDQITVKKIEKVNWQKPMVNIE